MGYINAVALPDNIYQKKICLLYTSLDFHVVHQLLAAGQPGVGGDDTLMGSQDVYKRQPAVRLLHRKQKLPGHGYGRFSHDGKT